MKKVLLALLLFTLPFISKAGNRLVLQNNTGNEISVAIVSYNHTQKCWESRGWFTVSAKDKEYIELDPLDLGSNKMYVYAENSITKWPGTTPFRIDANVFDIPFADRDTKKKKSRLFAPIVVGKGDTLYPFK